MFKKLLLAAMVLTMPTALSATEYDPNRPATVVVAFDETSITPLIVEGVANRESGRELEANDPVRIASISKLIMALATLRLVDEGKVDLEADVSDYLGWKVRSPNFPDAKVTLAQLLSHRSGLRDAAGYVIPLGESLQAKLAEPKAWYTDAPPGKAPFAYANLGSPVVATVLEAATSERYDQLLERTVFAPLGIEACVNWIGCNEEQVARAVTLYRDTGEIARDDPSDVPPNCTIPVAEGVECGLENYIPGTNASIFSPQGGVRIGMMDLAKLGQSLGRANVRRSPTEGFEGELENDQATPENEDRKAVAVFLIFSAHEGQELYCLYDMHFHAIPSGVKGCKDDLFGDGGNWIGHAGQAYGLESGLWINRATGEGFAFFLSQAPPPLNGEDTGGFTQTEIALMKRAQELLAAKSGD